MTADRHGSTVRGSILDGRSSGNRDNTMRGLTVRVDSNVSLADSDCSLPSVTSVGSDGFSPAMGRRGSSTHSLIAVNSESNLDEILRQR